MTKSEEIKRFERDLNESAAFSNAFADEIYIFRPELSLDNDTALIDCAPEICRRLDVLLVGKLWR